MYAADRGASQVVYAFGVHDASSQPPILVKPRWSREMTPDELREVEDGAYAEWLAAVELDARQQGKALNLFERNIEVWRELWRVLERSSVLVHLADARCPLLHVSDRLVEHIASLRPRKQTIIVLTKTDLVPDERVTAWIEYLEARFEGNVPVLAYDREDIEGSNATLLRAVGRASQLLEPSASQEEVDGERTLTFGFVGEPNVGKSSLLNSLFGRKLVSVSATPGRTKHWQTHFFDRVELLERGHDVQRALVCDCPGVVFPRLDVPPALQVLFGSFPIAQTREPFSAVRFLAENCAPPLHELYKLRPVDTDDGIEGEQGEVEVVSCRLSRVGTHSNVLSSHAAGWSPYALCEAYAKLRGFTVKGGKLDVHRAANGLLRDALGGNKVALSFPPPAAASSVDDVA